MTEKALAPSYRYHHGFYDGTEREFRGFGRVDQYDTEELGALGESGAFPDATNIDAASYVPTVLTKTWFHTGGYFALPPPDRADPHPVPQRRFDRCAAAWKCRDPRASIREL
jgi:hypothetical protein